MSKRNHRGLSVVLIVATIISILAPVRHVEALSSGSAVYGTEPWLLSAEREPEIDKSKQALYFGVLEAATASGYTVSLIELEVLAGEEVYAYKQEAGQIVEVTVRSYTDVVTTDGSRRLLPQTPVVVAGYEQPDGRIEALVVGDMQTAEMVEPEQNGPLTAEQLQRQAEAFNRQEEVMELGDRQKGFDGQTVKQEVSIESASSQEGAITAMADPNEWADKRYATVSGDYSKSYKWNQSVPAVKVGAFLTVSLYFEAFAGLDLNWSFPFEVDARLEKPLRYLPYQESRLLPGETLQQRDQRMLRNKAMLEVDVKPLRQEEHRTLFAETGLRLNVGLKGTVVGHDFDVKLDILKIAGAASGVSPGLHMQVGGKYAAPLFGKSEAFGIKEKIGLDKEVLDCNVISCTIDLFTDDSIGIGLPFFEAGVFSIGFLMQPVVMVYGDYPKLTGFEATDGLTVETMSGYDHGFRNVPVPVQETSVIYPYDALLLHVSDIGATPPPQLADEEGTFELSFDVDYHPRAMIGFVYQGTIKAKKLGIGGEVRLPMMTLPVPFNFDLSALGGGSGRATLTCSSKEQTIENCSGGALSYVSESVIKPMELSIGALPDAVGGAYYDSGELQALGGAGNTTLKASGLLPEGLELARVGSAPNGNGKYRLEGTPQTREGVYAIRLKATDREGGSREFELPLSVNQMYPERIEAELQTGQLWSRQFRLSQPDGTSADGVIWRVEGNLPAEMYELNEQGRLQTVPSQLTAGDYEFEVIAEWNGALYRTGTKHRLRVSEADVRNEREWSVVHAEPTGMVRGYGSALWHDQLGSLALVLPGRGAVLYDGSAFEQAAQLELPYHTSMSYVYPEGEAEDGWAYIFGGAEQPYYYQGDYAGDVYRWDERGVIRLYEDPKDGSGPTVFDAATAALPDGRLLVFGGDYGNYHQSGAYKPKLSNETWLFHPDEGRFEKVAALNSPSPRSGKQIMTYVPEIGKAVLIGQHLNGAAFVPQEREEEIWLFDPDTLQWSEAEGGSKLTLSPDEGTQLVYSRGERKLYVLVTETTPATIREQDRPITVERLYSISTEGGQLGGLIDESGRLPKESEAWGRGGAGFAYDEHNGRLVYLDDKAYSRLDVWSYSLPLAESDKTALTADGEDKAEFQFDLGRYVDDPSQWLVRWLPAGRSSLLGEEESRVTAPDEHGIVRLSVSYDNYAMTGTRSGSLLLIAEHATNGSRIPIGYARIALHPVPASTANSRVQLTPDIHDYWGDTGMMHALATMQSELTIMLRSEGGYSAGASESGGAYKGEPLAGRKLTLLNAEELERQGLRVYTGEIGDASMDRNDYDEYKFLATFEGYSQSVYTDDNGQVKLNVVNIYPDRLPIGEYPLRFEVGDGSGLIVETTLEVLPRQPEPVRASYGYELWASEPFVMNVALDGYEQWHSYACSDASPLSCFELVSGQLPDGMALNRRSGTISGIPREEGVYEVGVKTPYQADGTANVAVMFTVLQPLRLDPSKREWRFAAQVGDPFHYALSEQVKGGVGPFSFELIEGTLPPGLSFSADDEGRTAGYLAGTFTKAGVYSVKVNISEAELRASATDSGGHIATAPRSVEKTLIFNISEAESYGTAFSVFDKVKVTTEAGLWVSGLDGIPEGGSAGAFTPYGGSAYYKLIRPSTTMPAPFELIYDEYSQVYADDWLGWYYWSPHDGAWLPFADGSYSTEGAAALVSGDAELRQAWRRGADRFMGYYEYDYLYVAIGQAPQPAPVLLEAIDQGFTDGAGSLLVQLTGEHFTEDGKVYVGAREALQSYVNYSDGTGMSVFLPPGYGTKDVVVVTRGGVSNAVPFTYAGEPKTPAYDLELRVSVKTKEEAEAVDPGKWFLFEGDQVVYVDLYDGSGKRVALDEVLLKETEACDSLPEEERGRCFDPSFTLANWTNIYDNSTETLQFRCLPSGGSSCEEESGYHASPIIKGTLAPDGTFRAVLRRTVDLCVEECGSDDESEVPDETYPGAEIDVVISNEDGYYGRVIGNAPAPERDNYASDATEPLRIETAALSELQLDASEPYAFMLQAAGGREGSYEWRWGDSFSVPPGLVLERETGLLRAAELTGDPSVPNIQPGTYALTIAVSDGLTSASRSYTLTVTGQPERNIALSGLLVHQGNPQEPLPLQGAEDELGTSLYAAIPYETDDLYVLPFLGEYTEHGQTVTDSVYRVYAEVSVAGSLVPPQPDGSFKVSPGEGWTDIRIAALVKEGDTLVTARMYTLLVKKSQSAELERLQVNAPGAYETIELPLKESSGEALATIPADTNYITVRPSAVDPTAVIRLTVNGEPASERYLTSGWESSAIYLPAGDRHQLTITASVTDGSGEQVSRTYTVNVVKTLSADASLGALAFSPEWLTETYAGQAVVELEVPYEQSAIMMLATPSHPSAGLTVAVNGLPAHPDAGGEYSLQLRPGGNEVKLEVLAENGYTRSIYTVLVNRTLSNRASLANLETDFFDLDFDPAVHAYTAAVQSDIDTVRLAPMPEDAGATLELFLNGAKRQGAEGRFELRLMPGDNDIRIRVTAADGVTTRQYRVTVQRAYLEPEQVSANAQLAALQLQAGTAGRIVPLSPAFRPGMYTYTAAAEAGTAIVALSAPAANFGATVLVTRNGLPVEAGADGRYVLDVTDASVHDIVVRILAEDGMNNQAYRIRLTLDVPSSGGGDDGGTGDGGGEGSGSDSESDQGALWTEELMYGDGFKLTVQGHTAPAASKPVIRITEKSVREAAWDAMPDGWPDGFPLTVAYEAAAAPASNELRAVVEFALGVTPDILPDGYRLQAFVYDAEAKKWLPLASRLGFGTLTAESSQLGAFALFLVGSTGIPATDGDTGAAFGDTAGHWAEPWIALGTALGYANGFEDGSFRPQRPISRIEFIAMLMRAGEHSALFGPHRGPLEQVDGSGTDRVSAQANLEATDSDRLPPFADWADMPAWGTEYVLTAHRYGIVQGYADGTFRPHESITRAEMMTMLARSLQLPEGDPSALNSFKDEEAVPEWAMSAAASLMEARLVNGRSEGLLAPLEQTTRAEVIKLLVEVYLNTLRNVL
ncbi:cadherin-like beta sandwich domain-containing protein [Paenibacillus chungangensis]|uniref:Cadherin-like beta sandwich domain-containing protein n=1 Tax=Paenibacillus chungangensis TaxID=696535 RepID=A0ABW3HVX2_9BACL